MMFGPLLPLLSDSRRSIDRLLQRAADLGVDDLWVDALNPRPKVWPSVAELLRKEFPELLPRYRRILFDATARKQYLTELRRRVEAAAGQLSLDDRVKVCF